MFFINECGAWNQFISSVAQVSSMISFVRRLRYEPLKVVKRERNFMRYMNAATVFYAILNLSLVVSSSTCKYNGVITLANRDLFIATVRMNIISCIEILRRDENLWSPMYLCCQNQKMRFRILHHFFFMWSEYSHSTWILYQISIWHERRYFVYISEKNS